MKPANIMKMLPALLLVVVLISCNDNNDNKELHPLTFEKESYEVAMKRTTPIMIRSGNRDYTLLIEDPEILQAELDLSSPNGIGYINVTGKQKGETILSVTDNITHETVELRIKVIYNYLAFTIGNSNHPALTDDIIMWLIDDEARTCYFISEDHPSPGTVSSGKYEFSVTKETDNTIPYLTLTYASDEEGRFTDAAITDATITPTPHVFDISGNKLSTYEALANFLNIDWEKLIEEQSGNSLRSELQPTMLKMKEVGTEYEITSYLLLETIPEGILE